MSLFNNKEAGMAPASMESIQTKSLRCGIVLLVPDVGRDSDPPRRKLPDQFLTALLTALLTPFLASLLEDPVPPVLSQHPDQHHHHLRENR